MITGHFGLAGAARSISRERMSSALFAALLLAALAPDITDALYSVAGICSPYGLFSHTVHAVAIEAAVVGGAALLVTGSRRVAFLFVAVVLLHVPADFVTGRKLLTPGGEMFGLRLYDVPLYDWLVELPIVLGGWWLLRRSGRAPRWATSAWALGLTLLLQTAFDVTGSVRGRGVRPNACSAEAPVVPA